MLTKPNSNRLSQSNKDLSLQQLAKLSSFLEGQQHQTAYIRKQITNQQQIARKNDQIISSKITKINLSGEQLAKKYEQEKEKYEKLSILVKHIEEEIYRNKMEKANDLKLNIETDKLAEMTEVLNNKEKHLEKVSEKTNNASYDLAKKIDNIRALRSERTIVSALFDKIQRQLCSLEHCYKVLVIDRKKQEECWQQAVNEFNQLQNSGNRELSKFRQKKDKAKNRLQTEKTEKTQAKNTTDIKTENRLSVAFTNNDDLLKAPRKRSQLSKEKDRQREKAITKFAGDQVKIERERTVKYIFNDLGISSTKELPPTLEDLHSINEQLLAESNQIYQQLVTAQQSLKKLTQNKKNKPHPSQRRATLNLKKTVLSQYSQQIRQNRLQLTQFKEGCKILINSIRQSQGKQVLQAQFLNDKEEIVHYMAQLEIFFQKSYVSKNIKKPKKDKPEPKRLTCLLTSTHEHNNMSIYEEKDLLEYAKKNLGKLDKLQKSIPLRTQK